MRTRDNFIDFCNNTTYRQRLDSYFDTLISEIKSQRNVLLIIQAVMTIGVIVFCLCIEVFKNYHITILIIIGIIFINLISFFSKIKSIKKQEMYDINSRIYGDLVWYITGDKTREYYPRMQVQQSFLERSNLFNLDIVKYQGGNYTRVVYGETKKKIVICDIKLYVYDYVTKQINVWRNGRKYIRTVTRRVKKNIFQGIFFDTYFNKPINQLIYLIPNNFKDKFLQSKIYNYISYDGKKVDLENLNFSNNYAVYSDNEIQARYILSLSLMEKINELDKLFDGKKYIVFKPDGRFSIFIEGYAIEQLKKQKIPLSEKEISIEYLADYFDKVNNLFKIYYVLNLQNNLYKNNIANK